MIALKLIVYNHLWTLLCFENYQENGLNAAPIYVSSW
jgi:hypothetical protein